MKYSFFLMLLRSGVLLAIPFLFWGCPDPEPTPSPTPTPGITGATTGQVIFSYDPSKVTTPTSLKIGSLSYLDKLTTDIACSSSTSKVTLNEGNYVLTADNGLAQYEVPFPVIKGQCNTVVIDNTNIKSGTKGAVVFDGGYESGMRDISITLDGQPLGTVKETLIYSPVPTNPSSSVMANIPPGSHNYTAESTNGHKWSGTFTVGIGQTVGFYLGKYNASPVPANSCNIVFYSQSKSGILVSLSGNYIGKSLVFYAAGTSDICIRKWVVSIIKPVGSYSYTATDNNGNNWSGTVNANASGGCVVVVL